MCSTNLPESFAPESILAEQCWHHQEQLWVRMIGQRERERENPETNLITIKSETVSHMEEQFP